MSRAFPEIFPLPCFSCFSYSFGHSPNAKILNDKYIEVNGLNLSSLYRPLNPIFSIDTKINDKDRLQDWLQRLMSRINPKISSHAKAIVNHRINQDWQEDRCRDWSSLLLPLLNRYLIEYILSYDYTASASFLFCLY